MHKTGPLYQIIRYPTMASGSLDLHLVSPEMVWWCVKKNSAFRVKGQHGVVLSGEPGNPLSFHSYRYSGLVPRPTVDVQGIPDVDQDGVIVSTTVSELTNHPARSKAVKKLRKSSYTAYRASLKKAVEGAARPDLEEAVTRRVVRVVKSKIYKKNHKK